MEDIDVLWCEKMEMIEQAEMDVEGIGKRPLTEDEFDDYLWQQWTVTLAFWLSHQLSILSKNQTNCEPRLIALLHRSSCQIRH